MVKMDVVGLYPSKPHVAGLETLRKALDNWVDKKISTDNLTEMTHGKENLGSFLEDLNKFYPNIKFSHEVNKESIHFLDLIVRLSDGKISTDLLQTSTNFSTTHNLIPSKHSS